MSSLPQPLSQPEAAVRKATVSDAAAITELIRPFAERDLMLPRPLGTLYEAIRDFLVAERDGQLIGCVALHVFDNDLGEIKSLAVAAAAQGEGIGRRLVEAAVEEARSLGLRRIFALVLKIGWFERLGFAVVSKDDLPQKVWGECIFCPKFHRCDETAVVWETT